MKKLSQIALRSAAILILAGASVLANIPSTPVFLSIKSPDHPATWDVSGVHQSAKNLRWDSARGMLVVDVKYSTADYADSIINPIATEEYSLAFPGVRLGKDGASLLATDRNGDTATIGYVKNGFFGKEIVLNKEANVNVHRHNGKIYASLVYNSLM